MSNSFGWGDPIESPITLAYRRKGEKQEHEFSGPVAVLGEDRKTLTWLKRGDLPLVGDRLDLTRVPVVGIGGKRRHQPGRVQSFLAENLSFQGAFVLYPGTGDWDLGEGMLFVTSREILSGRRVSGGKPEVQFTNHRWLCDGRYVADRARMLHGKVLETLATEVEQEPDAEKIAEAILNWCCQFGHRLHEECKAVANELRQLEERRVMLTDEKPRDITALVRERLAAKFREAGVQFVRDIPDGLTVTAEEIAPELVLKREILGTVEVPGLGRRLPEKRFVDPDPRRSETPVVMVLAKEFRQITAWPFGGSVFLGIVELEGGFPGQFDWTLWNALRAPESERLSKVRECFSRQWQERQRSNNRPKDAPIADPREANPPATPEPVVWGFDLMTGEEFNAHAALVHDVRGMKGRIVDGGWSIRWYDDADQAAKADAEARREAESYITARRLEAELTETEVTELPAPVPAPYTEPCQTPEAILAMAGFASDQYRILTDVGYWYFRGISGRRDYDGDWCEGRDSTASFARKGNDGVWEIGKDGLTHLFEGGSLGDWNWQAFAKPVLAEMGVGEKKIAAIKAQIKAELEASKEAYREALRSFAWALQAEPAHTSLSSDMQAKLAGLASTDWGTPAVDEAELRREWGKAEALRRRSERGEILVNFGGHFRVMGATGNCDYWVVQPDGTLRDPDEVSYRKRYTSEGEKQWRLVGPDELALLWRKGYTAAPHEFEIAKRPVGGLTAAQLATVEELEQEIAKRFDGTVGCSDRESPPTQGWGLCPAPKPAPTPAASASGPVEGLNLSGLFGGAAVVNDRHRR